jgi:hypothetical protein
MPRGAPELGSESFDFDTSKAVVIVTAAEVQLPAVLAAQDVNQAPTGPVLILAVPTRIRAVTTHELA